MNRTHRVTSCTVAAACGVSQATVSRILGGKHAGLYCEETQKKVIETARTLRYRRNTAARAIASGRFHAAGFLFRDDGSTLGSGMIYGVNQVLMQHDLRLILSPLHPGEEPDRHPAMLSELSVDGLLVSVMHDVPDEFRQVIEAHKLPVVWINTRLENNCVRPDDHQITAGITRQLIALGHRSIGYIGHDQRFSRHYSGQDRALGYQYAMTEARLSPIMVNAGPSHAPAEILKAAHEALRLSPLPSAFVCEKDAMAQAMLYAAALRGIQVPRQLSIAAVLNAESNALGVTLAGACIPFRKVGEAAANMLHRLIETGENQVAEAITSEFKAGSTVIAHNAK